MSGRHASYLLSGSAAFLLTVCCCAQWCRSAEVPRATNLRLRTCATPADRILPLPPTTTPTRHLDKPIAELSTDIRPPAGQLPDDVETLPAPEFETYLHTPTTARNWNRSQYCWEASCLQHQPLYFEDINLERHGHRVPFIQPAISAAHFFGRVPALPYLTALDPPRHDAYVLGHTRPGSWEPCPIRLMPVEIVPALVQAAAVTGLIFVVP